MKAKLEIKHNMEANELRFHKNIIKSLMLASEHQNRILSIFQKQNKEYNEQGPYLKSFFADGSSPDFKPCFYDPS